MRRRSRSVAPPHTPSFSRTCNACSRQEILTEQPAQIATASATASSESGKKMDGSNPTHAPCLRHDSSLDIAYPPFDVRVIYPLRASYVSRVTLVQFIGGISEGHLSLIPAALFSHFLRALATIRVPSPALQTGAQHRPGLTHRRTLRPMGCR